MILTPEQMRRVRAEIGKVAENRCVICHLDRRCGLPFYLKVTRDNCLCPLFFPLSFEQQATQLFIRAVPEINWKEKLKNKDWEAIEEDIARQIASREVDHA